VFSDHNNLQFFTTTKQLSRRQARWSEFLSGFDFNITYRPGRLGGKPDALTRRRDVYPKKEDQDLANKLNHRVLIKPEQLLSNFILNEEEFLEEIKAAPKDSYYQSQIETLTTGTPGPFTQEGDLLLRRGKVYVPDHKNLRLDTIRNHHDHKLFGHPGIRKTIQLISWSYFWPGLKKSVERYVRNCHICICSKSVRKKRFGLLKPLPIGERPWSSISVDHIVALPESNECDAIMVVVCRLTKQAIFVPCRTRDTAAILAKHFIKNVFRKHGLPTDIISDRGTMFTASFWQSLCKALDVHTNLSTVYHPQTDGQTE